MTKIHISWIIGFCFVRNGSQNLLLKQEPDITCEFSFPNRTFVMEVRLA